MGGKRLCVWKAGLRIDLGWSRTDCRYLALILILILIRILILILILIRILILILILIPGAVSPVLSIPRTCICRSTVRLRRSLTPHVHASTYSHS